MRVNPLRSWLPGFAAIAAVLVLGGCTSNLKEQNVHLLEENEGLRAQLVDRNEALAATQEELRGRDMQIADLNSQLANASAWTPPATPADPFSAIEGVTGTFAAGELTATVESDVLFDPGKTTLKPGAKRSLDAVARILTGQYGLKPIRVAGYTDTDPIRKSGYKSNYHLGFERAYAVREYLISRGVSTDLVYVASHGPTQAKASKKESRRVEIAVVLEDS